jgi:hypothetical protein
MSLSGGSSMSPLKAQPLFPPIVMTYSGSKASALSSGAALAATKTEQPSSDPAQAVAALLSSLSLPPLASSPASQSSTSAASSSSSSSTASAPSLFSGYLLSILHSTLSDLWSALSLTGAALDDAELSCSPQLVIALKDHFQLESQYALLCNAMRQLSAEDEAFSAQQQLVQDQYLCLMDSTRSLLRLLPSPPAAAASAPQSPFYVLFSHLVALITTRLHLSAKEASKQQQLLSTLTSQQTADAASIASLTHQLAAARQHQSLALSQQEALLRKYQSQLSSLLDGAEEEALTFNRRMKEEEEESERLFDSRQAELETELQRLRDVELQEGQREEWRLEAGMRRKLSVKEEEVQAVIAKYDADMSYQHELYHELSTVFQREREEATRLRLYFDRVKERKDRSREEMEALRLRRDDELLRAREREEALRLLAALYDGWMRKHGPKEKKRPAADKKKKTKLMWRPPREENNAPDDATAAAAASSQQQQEAAQPASSR